MKQSKYLVEGKFKCECGREFEKGQSLNAHFSRCSIHRKGKPNSRVGKDPFRNLSEEKRKEIYGKRDDKIRGRIYTESHCQKISESLSIAASKDSWKKSRGDYEIDSFGKRVWLDSSYEIRFVKLLNKLDIKWEKNSKFFLYEFEGRTRRYTPDFCINGNWIEVKGWEKELDRAKWNQFPHSIKIVKIEDLLIFEKVECSIELLEKLAEC